MEKEMYFLFAFTAVLLAVLVAAAGLSTPIVTFSNNATPHYDEGNFNINWSAITNATSYSVFIYSNGNFYKEASNTSKTGYHFSNTTEANYTFIVEAKNSTGTSANSTSVSMYVDSSAPTISIGSGGWHSQNLTIYATAKDTLSNVTSTTIYFWFGNSTNNYSITKFASCNYINATVGFNCSSTFNTTSLAGGNYTLWVNASDNVGNIRHQSIPFGVDNVNPVAVASCSPSTDYSGYTFPCSCTGTDSLSGIASSTGTSTSSDGTGTPYKSGTFTYTCTVEDYAGNSGNTSTTYKIIESSGGGSVVYNNYNINQIQLDNGYSVNLSENDKLSFNAINENHSITINSISGNIVTLTVASAPQVVSITEGQTKKIDLNNNGIYDIEISLNSIANNKADLTIKAINETVPSGKTTNETTKNSTGNTSPNNGMSAWDWILIVVIVIIAFLWWMKVKKKR